MAKPELSNQRSERKLPPSPRPAPWLVIPHGKNRKFQTFLSIFDHPLNKSYKKFIPELSGKRFWQKNSHQGWLIIVCCEDDDPNFNNGDCFLWNPTSLEIIMLPNIDHYNQLDGYRIQDCLLSSPPQSSSSCRISSTNGDDGSVVYILYNGGKKPDILIYCRPGEKEWRKHEFVDVVQSLKSMFYVKGKLHIMCLCEELLEITVQCGSGIDEEEETLSLSISILITNDEDSLCKSEDVGGSLVCKHHTYYMESFGEIFRINRYYIQRGCYEHFVTKIVVSKLDFDSLTWEEVKILNDYVFFIGYRDTRLSCLASDLGLTKGCVYFTLKCDLSLYMYDLEDESISLSLPCPDTPAPWLSPRWLIIPTPSRVDDSRTTTDLMLCKDEATEKVIKAMENRTCTKDKDDENKDIEHARLWVKLDDDMVWTISNFLHTLDYIHLRAVSKKYRSVLHMGRYSSNRTVQITDISPWLFFPMFDQAVYKFVNPVHNNETYLMNIPESLKGARIRFSKGGWLLMSKHKSLFFYNPFTKSIVRLPNLPDSDFTGISFSSLPTSSDCLVFGIAKDLFRDQVHIFFTKRGYEDWSYAVYNNIYLPPHKKKMDFEPTLNSPVFYRGRFYCLDHNGTLGVFKHEHPNRSWEILSMITPPNCGFIYDGFLVECEGKLLSVLLGRLGNWIRIFRLDVAKMVWLEVKHLGRHMLFLSNESCISALAPTSQMENKIYFPRLHNEGILYYSLDTGMYHSLGSCHSAKDFRDSKKKLHCSWIEPNWSEISDHHLEWLKI
ncbi:hypothetical protein MKW98_021627 [Papaver atlanticum]|uniref:KIB1-4 beta-propeller domain-containing protein n=1 Tax=Papaver atlanticum TaxID=357466 RepID=A0AAD4T9K9_9MAGN|nr:hypothetical protein MKW98_021627 [Papaver atlanticum]